jgi:uncharacterized protein
VLMSRRGSASDHVIRHLRSALVSTEFARELPQRSRVIIADGDRVMVQARGLATTKRGDPYDQTYCLIFRVRDGRLTEVVEYCDTALVERVLRPPPAGPKR